MIIYPSIYSKATSAEKLLQLLKAAPKQISNSPEAFKGQVVEFTLNGRGPYGTLSELFNHLHESNFEIVFPTETVCVTRDNDGNWTPCVR